MKALLLFAAAGLLSTGAVAQMTNSMGNTMTTTHETHTKTVHKSMKTDKMMDRHHHMAMHRHCSWHMRHGHKTRVCSSHRMRPMHHHVTTVHQKVTVETKKPM